ncbi:GDSL esterase/lipase At5g45910 isoform X2 [Brachypodium distachyon]|uniref:Esterase n=1 Tax=Brachypodium distachyon TaxID=15368 RepID=I1HD95_BRADI|nr:GDSL esterase/lipase At5g45910 isoform X2 [Brachypodium distachyon]KQK03299.1 hypothetical protein BRADI_2g06940v3 [Brachypodium distachyon]|eukprot:XP_003565527.1 GDSL esterase/lipase At5g45910 isoform X2 [Brachypodium distachyon]
MPTKALVSILFLLLLLAMAQPGSSSQGYNAIYNFGDSISDTGNLCLGGCPSWLTTGQPPYGKNYFGRPTGRCSDGRVFVDFLAEYFGLPLLPPSKTNGTDFKKGANMAIVGATAMNMDFFKSRGLTKSVWNSGSLEAQISWFQQLMPSICGNANDCKSYLKNSLFIVGEFGGNDYNAGIFGRRSLDEVKTYVGQITDKVRSGVQTLLGLGAVDVVVPGVLPIGCFPVYLTLYGGSNQGDYDGDGCLKRFNDLSGYHNELLRQGISSLQSKYPGARLMYGDFYNHVTQMVRSPSIFGLKYGLRVCCGAGGQGSYNYNNEVRCGTPGACACGDPADYLFWDGIHLTEAAYRSVANGWLNGPYCIPAILH